MKRISLLKIFFNLYFVDNLLFTYLQIGNAIFECLLFLHQNDFHINNYVHQKFRLFFKLILYENYHYTNVF